MYNLVEKKKTLDRIAVKNACDFAPQNPRFATFLKKKILRRSRFFFSAEAETTIF
jgi:hypothetical protein